MLFKIIYKILYVYTYRNTEKTVVVCYYFWVVRLFGIEHITVEL